jgi:hypothetical protein
LEERLLSACAAKLMITNENSNTAFIVDWSNDISNDWTWKNENWNLVLIHPNNEEINTYDTTGAQRGHFDFFSCPISWPRNITQKKDPQEKCYRNVRSVLPYDTDCMTAKWMQVVTVKAWIPAQFYSMFTVYSLRANHLLYSQ